MNTEISILRRNSRTGWRREFWRHLVPIPNRDGFADNTLLLAHFVSGMTGGKGKVLDIMKGNARASIYDLKKEGKNMDDDLLVPAKQDLRKRTERQIEKAPD